MTRVAMALLLGVSPPVAAQGDCFPSPSSNEAQTFAILSVPVALGGGGTAHPGRFGVGLELVTVPEVPREVATPTTCRPGKGPENTNPVPALGRVRVAVRHAGWLFEVGWIPPVTVEQVRANLVGVAVARPFAFHPGWVVSPRIHAVLGAVRAPVTCNDAALEDPGSECFNGTRSNDRWRPGIYGADLTLSRGAGWAAFHVGAGWTALRPRFQVNFTNAQGETDRRKVEVDLTRATAFAGATLAAGRFRMTAEGYATLEEPIALRFVARTHLGGT
jgi:hypothetical protein